MEQANTNFYQKVRSCRPAHESFLTLGSTAVLNRDFSNKIVGLKY
jgi:hypothetical protein